MAENKIGRVFALVSIFFVLYFGFSVFSFLFGISVFPLNKINLISEIVEKKKTKQINKAKNSSIKTFASIRNTQSDFDLYKKAGLITDFTTGEHCVLSTFASKLNAIQQGKPIKIRIAFLGDSMIEADLMTQTLRSLLQKEFGGYGVGFLTLSTPYVSERTTATIEGNNWSEINFMNKNFNNMYLSGYIFSGNGSGLYTDHTVQNQTFEIEKSLIFAGNQSSIININGKNYPIEGKDLSNRFMFARDNSNTISLNSKTNSKLFGVSFESPKGIILDNFSFRGITGIELDKLQDDLLKSIQKNNPYDLVILQYGVNMLFRPNDTNYDYYDKKFSPVLEKLKRNFSGADFLIIGSADRAFRYDGQYKTAIGLPNLLKTQAGFAAKNKMAFYNNFASMGGENTIVKWAEQVPALANKDYIHPNQKGAELLAQKLYNALMNDYKIYKKTITSNN